MIGSIMGKIDAIGVGIVSDVVIDRENTKKRVGIGWWVDGKEKQKLGERVYLAQDG